MLINQPATTNTDHFRARPPGATSSLTAMRVLVADSFDSSGLDALAKAGCTVTELTPAQHKAFADACASVYANWEPKIGKALVDDFKATVAKMQ